MKNDKQYHPDKNISRLQKGNYFKKRIFFDSFFKRKTHKNNI